MFSTAFAGDLLKLIMHGVAIANIADNAASSPFTQYFIALHTADPGAGGTQDASELNYTGYARIALPRLAANWPITGNVIHPSARIEFGEMTAGVDQLATWMSIGIASTGSTKILLRGALTPNVQCRLGVIPAIKPDTAITFVTV